LKPRRRPLRIDFPTGSGFQDDGTQVMFDRDITVDGESAIRVKRRRR
jgi:hypothetical protein